MGQMKPGGIRKALELLDALGIEKIPVPEIKARPVRRGAACRVRSRRTVPDKREALEALRAEMGDCSRCKLSAGRTNIVFGEGNPDAELMFIGEAPGRDEDIQGRPFVGKAGVELTKLIQRIGFEREEVYIGNICKCRPPENRNPQPDEIAACLPIIKGQLSIISPRVIIALGNIAVRSLFSIETPISHVRGKVMEYEGIPVVPTFHPAYWLRNSFGKWDSLRDAIVALDILGRKEKSAELKEFIKKYGNKKGGAG